MKQSRPCRVAAVQAAPVHLDLDGTLSKMEHLIAEASENGANLIVFPEVFISAYPAWVPDIFTSSAEEQSQHLGRPWFEYWNDYLSSSIAVPSDATSRIGRAARAANAVVVVGVNERVTHEDDQVQLYNTSLVIDSDGELIGKHRKLTPVVHEQFYHGRGDERDVRLFPTEFGNLGVAQCFENFSPLYKHSLASMGEQIHCALWFSTEANGPMAEAAARIHALESGTWVVVATQYISDLSGHDSGLEGTGQWRSMGGSMVVSPAGRVVAGPVYGEETIVYADIDPVARRAVKAYWDPIGRESRPDVFDFKVRRREHCGPIITTPTEDRGLPVQISDSVESETP